MTLDQQDLTSQKIIDDLRQLIKILRRDKDIAETSHDITKQERDRIKLQTEHIQRSLDETRVLLDEERKRNQDALGSEQKHAELMEKINQLNILRESNASLRLQSEDRSKKVVQLEQSLKTTQSQLLPLQEQISNLNAELEASKSEIKALEEDNDRWKGRTQQILAKYERIDPVEHQRLKDQVNSFTLEKVQLEKEREELVKELDGLKKSSHDSLKEAISLKDAEIQESKNKIEETTKALEESMGERTRIANRFNDLAKKFQLSTKELKELNEKVRSIQEEKVNNLKVRRGQRF